MALTPAVELSYLKKEERSHPQYTKEQVVTWISQFKYGNFNDPEYQKEIIDIFVNSVYIYDEMSACLHSSQTGAFCGVCSRPDAVGLILFAALICRELLSLGPVYFRLNPA